MTLRSILLGAASSLALAGGSYAADMNVKAAPYAAPVGSWAGSYIGGHVGGARYNMSEQNFTEVGVCGDTTGSVCSGGASGFIGGFQIGHNWQSRNLVYGVEADWAWTGLDNKDIESSGSINTRMNWLATFRGRMGLAVDSTLVYVTGGLAIAEVESGFTANYVCCGRRNVYGWVAGMGVEHMFAPRWSFKAEFLYHDLGRETTSNTFPQGTYTTNFHHEVFTAKIGLNYKLPW